MYKKVLLVIVAAIIILPIDSFRLCAKEAHNGVIVPPMPQSAPRYRNVFCHSIKQIQEVVRLSLVGNSIEEAAMQVNAPQQVRLCEPLYLDITKFVRIKSYATSSHLVTIYRVHTTRGVRFIFYARRYLHV